MQVPTAHCFSNCDKSERQLRHHYYEVATLCSKIIFHGVQPLSIQGLIPIFSILGVWNSIDTSWLCSSSSHAFNYHRIGGKSKNWFEGKSSGNHCFYPKYKGFSNFSLEPAFQLSFPCFHHGPASRRVYELQQRMAEMESLRQERRKKGLNEEEALWRWWPRWKQPVESREVGGFQHHFNIISTSFQHHFNIISTCLNAIATYFMSHISTFWTNHSRIWRVQQQRWIQEWSGDVGVCLAIVNPNKGGVAFETAVGWGKHSRKTWWTNCGWWKRSCSWASGQWVSNFLAADDWSLSSNYSQTMGPWVHGPGRAGYRISSFAINQSPTIRGVFLPCPFVRPRAIDQCQAMIHALHWWLAPPCVPKGHCYWDTLESL